MKKTLGQVNYEAWCTSFHPSNESKGQFEFQHIKVRDAEEASAQAVLAAAGVDAKLVALLRDTAQGMDAIGASGWTGAMGWSYPLRAAADRIEAALRGEVME